MCGVDKARSFSQQATEMCTNYRHVGRGESPCLGSRLTPHFHQPAAIVVEGYKNRGSTYLKSSQLEHCTRSSIVVVTICCIATWTSQRGFFKVLQGSSNFVSIWID